MRSVFDGYVIQQSKNQMRYTAICAELARDNLNLERHVSPQGTNLTYAQFANGHSIFLATHPHLSPITKIETVPFQGCCVEEGVCSRKS
jgi:hypothetical protein